MATNRKTGKETRSERADFKTYVKIELTPEDINAIREEEATCNPVAMITTLLELSYSVTLKPDSFGGLMASAIQQDRAAKDAGYGVSSGAATVAGAIVSLYFKLSHKAGYDLSGYQTVFSRETKYW